MRNVWDTDYVGDTRTLEVHIRWLRQKVEHNPKRPVHIITVRGTGTCLGGAAENPNQSSLPLHLSVARVVLAHDPELSVPYRQLGGFIESIGSEEGNAPLGWRHCQGRPRPPGDRRTLIEVDGLSLCARIRPCRAYWWPR